jgi:phage-related protein
LRIRHPEPNGSRWATPPSLIQQRPGQSPYRAVYTVKFEGVVYVLDAFQKKAKRGRATPQVDIARIRARLKMAEEHYQENYRVKKTG